MIRSFMITAMSAAALFVSTASPLNSQGARPLKLERC